LGISSVGVAEEDYKRTTYNLTLNVGKTLAKLNPEMAFCYVTGAEPNHWSSSKEFTKIRKAPMFSGTDRTRYVELIDGICSDLFMFFQVHGI
jgi:hypothetical protein